MAKVEDFVREFYNAKPTTHMWLYIIACLAVGILVRITTIFKK